MAEAPVTAPIDAQLAAYNNHDLDAFLACFADNVACQFPGQPPARGKDALRLAYEGFFAAFPDIKAVVRNRIVAGEYVVDEEIVTATHEGPFLGIPPTGRPIEMRAAIVYRVSAGQIHSMSVYSDAASLLAQLGLQFRPPDRPARRPMHRRLSLLLAEGAGGGPVEDARNKDDSDEKGETGP